MAPVRLTRRLPAALLFLAFLAGCGRDADVGPLLAQARHYRAQGEFSAAIIQLKNVLQTSPNQAVARRLLGEMYLEQLDPLAAEREFRRAIALGDDTSATASLLGQALLQQGQYEGVLDDVIADTAAGLSLHADAELGLDRTDEAANLYSRALNISPGMVAAELGRVRLALTAGDQDEGRRRLAALLAAHPDDREALRMQVHMLRQLGDGTGAALSCETLLKTYPHDARARIELATLLTDSGHFAQARLALQQAKSIAPAAVSLRMAEALLAYRERRYAAAAQSLQQLLRVSPTHFPAILLLATVEAASGADGNAEALLRQFLSAHPHHPSASKLLATLLLRSERHAEALATLDPLLREGKGDVDVLSLAGEAALRDGDFAQADVLFGQASILRPQAPLLRTALAISKFGNGDHAGALRQLAPTAKNAATPRTQALLIMAYLRTKDYDKAFQALDTMQRAGESAQLHNLRAAVYLAKQDLPAARASEERALALDPLFLPALANLAQLDAIEQRPADAIKRYQNALARAPSHPALLQALASLQRASSDDTALFAQYLQQKNWNAAGTLAIQVQQRDPATARGYQMAAEVHAGKGELAQAVAALDAALQREADAATLRRIHGILTAMGKSREADARLAAWLLAHPRDNESGLVLASGKLATGGR